ncbi:aminoglycoside phosphotransferase family protein [Paenibacillus sp. ATY16]|uniref:aminoglycoside phosphotransferase family protein n=1 Tax=Paenibacillus sp. ATY16 TaxID=1759312 RepID=UPI00200C2231|nr:aminoglycoside phosphotransferase family protein [Paenibacillus sp. ATY16]MCK9861681.1 aminoglycoside phosphotransferase family protein [Paenibacillus sp. ATY16]
MSVQNIAGELDKERLLQLSKACIGFEFGVITEWTCKSIGQENKNFVTDGVYRITGTSENNGGERRSWSFILKIVIPDPKRNDPAHYNYWRRESLVYGSHLLEHVPSNLLTPKCYAIDNKDNGYIWLWMEDVGQEVRPWTREDYGYVTEKLGEIQAEYLLGKPLPEFDWLNRHWMRSWLHECEKYRYEPDPDTREILLSDKRVASILDQYHQFEPWIKDWLVSLEQLPKTFSHQDFYEQNILLHDTRQREGKLTLIDWQFASISGAGEDLGRFLGLGLSRGQVTVDRFKEYRDLFISSYISGLRKAGWQGDEELVRFGYLAAFSLRSVWEVSKMLKKQAQNPDSPESKKLMSITELQMETAMEAEGIRGRLIFC